MGDTNDRYTNAQETLTLYRDQVGLHDSWVELENGGIYPTAGATPNACPNPAPDNKCEVVDKVL